MVGAVAMWPRRNRVTTQPHGSNMVPVARVEGMIRYFARLLLIACSLSLVSAQQVSLSPNSSVEVRNTASSSKPTLDASPPDAPMPDLGSIPGPSDASKSAAKRVLDQLMPRCLDGLFHTCWAPPPVLPASASKA